MTAATRVQLVPPSAWSEEELVAAAHALGPSRLPVRPGDAVSELVVVGVEPSPGSVFADETEVELLPAPRRADAGLVDVAILLDVSESMALPWDAQHTRLDAALVAIGSFLERPGGAVRDALVFHYAKEARLVAGPAPAEALRAGKPGAPKGPSRTASAVDAALAGLAARTRADRSQVILLFTDGVGEIDALKEATERAARLRVPIHALVFAPEVDDAFHDVARATGGSVQKAAYPLTIEFVHDAGADAP